MKICYDTNIFVDTLRAEDSVLFERIFDIGQIQTTYANMQELKADNSIVQNKSNEHKIQILEQNDEEVLFADPLAQTLKIKYADFALSLCDALCLALVLKRASDKLATGDNPLRIAARIEGAELLWLGEVFQLANISKNQADNFLKKIYIRGFPKFPKREHLWPYDDE